MTDPHPSPSNKPAKARRLPSFRVRCALAATLFVLGAAVGAALGPAPQSSLAGPAQRPQALIASLLAKSSASAPAAPFPTAPAAPAAPATPAVPAAPEPQAKPPTTSKETPLHKPRSSLRRHVRKLARAIPVVTLLTLPAPAVSQAEESNPNNYRCFGHIAPGKPEEGSSDQQVAYTLACSGPISGYAIQTQAPVQTTGFESAPLVSNEKDEAITTASFSCNGEIPGFGFDCVGNTTAPFQVVSGQFSIDTKLCVEPRINPRLLVTYAYLNEKKVITQAISGPFDMGRPHGCPAAAAASKKGKGGKGHGKDGAPKHAKGGKGKKK